MFDLYVVSQMSICAVLLGHALHRLMLEQLLLFTKVAKFDYIVVVSMQVKAFSRSLENFKTAIVVGGTNISEQVITWL